MCRVGRWTLLAYFNPSSSSGEGQAPERLSVPLWYRSHRRTTAGGRTQSRRWGVAIDCAARIRRCERCTRRATVWDRFATSATETTTLRRDRVINRMLASASSSSCSQWDHRRRFTSSSSSPSNSRQPSPSFKLYDYRWGRWLWYVDQWHNVVLDFTSQRSDRNYMRATYAAVRKTIGQKLIDVK